MDNCLFCKIVKGDIPSKKVYEDEKTLAFYDIAPQAPVHVLVIPKKHIMDWNSGADDPETMASLCQTVALVARKCGVNESGYRIVSNCGSDARQTVPHLHMHILAGSELNEKMA